MKVICINNSSYINNTSIEYLTKDKIYETTKKKLTDEAEPDPSKFITITNDKGILNAYFKSRFMTIKEYRKLKLKNLMIKDNTH